MGEAWEAALHLQVVHRKLLCVCGARARAAVLGEGEGGQVASASKKIAVLWLKMACLMWLLPALAAAATSWRGDKTARGAPGDAGREAAWFVLQHADRRSITTPLLGTASGWPEQLRARCSRATVLTRTRESAVLTRARVGRAHEGVSRLARRELALQHGRATNIPNKLLLLAYLTRSWPVAQCKSAWTFSSLFHHTAF